MFMDKIIAPLVIAVSAFLYFTHDAGFNFERASPEKRVAFAERQANQAVSKGNFIKRSEPGAVKVSPDGLHVRLKVKGDHGIMEGRRRADTFRQACKGYLDSYLDSHGIVLGLEFYAESGAMAGTLTLAPAVCERTVAMAR